MTSRMSPARSFHAGHTRLWSNSRVPSFSTHCTMADVEPANDSEQPAAALERVPGQVAFHTGSPGAQSPAISCHIAGEE